MIMYAESWHNGNERSGPTRDPAVHASVHTERANAAGRRVRLAAQLVAQAVEPLTVRYE